MFVCCAFCTDKPFPAASGGPCALNAPAFRALDLLRHGCGHLTPRKKKVGAFVAKTIAIVNQKGGVGKTTTCVNLAAALTEAGRRVLLCDFDPQANSTSGMGLSVLMNTVRIVRRSLNPGLELEGVLLTMFDGRTNLALQVAEEVKHYFPGKVYATVIPRNVRLSEAPSHGKPITAYDRSSRGAEAYTALAAEFLNKQSA